jgi:ferredoxin--NADP+ reductase
MRMSEQAVLNEPILPDAKMHLVPPTLPVTGRVVSSEVCTKGKCHSFVRHVAIDVSGTPLAGNFLVGQSFGVIPPGNDKHGKPHKVRLYSIASPSAGEDGKGNVLATTVKRTIDEFKAQTVQDDPNDHSLFLGVCSNYLCDLRVGDEVKVTGPNGKRFLLPSDPNEHDLIFMATGTGIAPFRGMLMELLNAPTPCTSQIHLLMGSPYTTDLLYDDLLRGMAAKHRNFHYHLAISRESAAGDCRGLYVDRLLSQQMERFAPLLQSPRTLLYICGLAGMQVGVFHQMAKHGMGEGYMTVKPELASVDPSQWDTEKIKRYVRPTRRCMLEVY